jgi:hypothetical protein
MSTSIHSRHVAIQQSPSEDNHFHAICYVTITTSPGQSVVAIGEAKGHSWDDVQGLLQQAEQNGYKRAIELLNDTIPPDIQNDTGSSWNQPKTYKSAKAGGGNKPASPKQIGLIENLCAKKHFDYHKFIKKEFGTTFDELTGSQANDAIRKLQTLG